MDQQNKPVIPTLKDSQKPQVKIKGLQAGLSLFDRLKQFKKKDLAFITAGMGVLFMAPLAEHFMMSPENGESGQISAGFGRTGGSGIGSGGSVYEGGINGLAPGGVTGGADVITPLNVRDPSSLVMGPGASQQAPATATAPAPAAPSKSESNDWKDALSNAASQGAQAATKKAALPVPHPAMANAGLRGLGSVGGGGGGSYSLPPISAANVPNRAADSNSLSRVTSAPGYRGAAGPRGSQNASAGSMENLKKAAGNAGSDFNRSGSAAQGLETAASQSMAGGGSDGGGGPGAGGADKAGAQSQSKDSSSTGESLEFLRMKAEQDKAIDLKWDLKKQQAKRWPNLVDKMTEEMIMTPLKGMTGGMSKMFGDWGGDKSKAKKYICSNGEIPAGLVKGNCPITVGKDDTLAYCWSGAGSLQATLPGGAPGTLYTGCKLNQGAADGGSNTETGTPDIGGGAGGSGSSTGKSLAGICAEVMKVANLKTGVDTANRDAVKTLIGKVNGAEQTLYGKASASACGVIGGDSSSTGVRAQEKAIAKDLYAAARKLQGALKTAQSGVGLVDDKTKGLKAVTAGVAETAVAEKPLTDVTTKAKTAYDDLIKETEEAFGKGATRDDNKAEPLRLEGEGLLLGTNNSGGGTIASRLAKVDADITAAKKLLLEVTTDGATLRAKLPQGSGELIKHLDDVIEIGGNIDSKSALLSATKLKEYHGTLAAANTNTGGVDGKTGANAEVAKAIQGATRVIKGGQAAADVGLENLKTWVNAGKYGVIPADPAKLTADEATKVKEAITTKSKPIEEGAAAEVKADATLLEKVNSLPEGMKFVGDTGAICTGVKLDGNGNAGTLCD